MSDEVAPSPPVKNASRKPHYKSRKGCLACKKRHVKCNESRPKCSHCARLEIECLWPDSAANALPSPHSPGQVQSHSPASSVEQQRQTGGPRPELAVDDMKLLHFWTVNTATSMNYASHLWQIVIVDMAFNHHFLLHGILAVAAIHKATIFSAEREALITQSSSHIGIAIASFRHLLATPVPATCVPVFLMAGLLSIHSLGLAQLRTPTDAVGEIYTWMRLVKGTQSTIQQNWQRLQASEIAPLLSRGRAGLVLTEVEEVNHLRSLVQDEVHLTAPERQTYIDAINQLQTVFGNVLYQKGDEIQASAMVSSWVALVPPEYHELLVSREPVALVIIAYFAVLFREQQGVCWWFRKWDIWILESVRAQLPTAYERWLEWPTAQIGNG
ncbi:C6 zinc finger domain-containing protein [Zymoseptoria brevis]|uniref:C6 zinc finger domain-containing protein n=1 Tax=Zymoseptoria brevis TaxID=1047168 RepID=A0A0F4GAZ2_9PEZI|nr:C6 zinc finger domain-containing protein [Zymoseptoria brevis]